ncbi:MAG TPA: M20/M25/M40 family metallo-hydrolase [Terriglobales bacterium]|nr:M20/M25/M40 family metallo-hydrolase [Terriglobales bacterium]
MKTRVLLAVMLFLLWGVSALGQDASQAIIDGALKPSAIEKQLRTLTDEIGGRVPGTPAMDKAVQWGVAAFKEAGADSVVEEPFTIPQSWSEGETNFQIVAPVQFKVKAVSFAWSPAIPTPLNARVVFVGNGGVEDFAKAGSVAGAIVVANTDMLKTWDDLFAEYMNAPGIIDRAVKGKAAVVAFLASREHAVLYRHSHSFDGRVDVLPILTVAREDGERIARLQQSGEKLQARLVMPNKVGGPAKTANVVAEIRGSELPDEYVILGAHLDSWDLGTGALDDGCNSALVVDALRAIKQSGAKPRRTIRFILFSGEEQGMLGSRAYVAQHRAELDKIAAVIIFDSGIGKVTGFSLGGRSDVKPVVTPMVAPLNSLGATTLTEDASWGTDNFDFLLEGVPTLVANQETGNYLVNYHAVSDTFDKVDIDQLKKHAAIAAWTTFAIANAPDRIGARQTREQIGELMKRTGLEDQMRALGGWDEWEKGSRGRNR